MKMKRLLLLVTAIGLPLAIPLSTHAASFDCAKAGTTVERQICGDPTLSRMDEQLNKVYREALATGPKPELLTSVQRDWLKDVRNQCANVQCLRDAYQSRLDDFLSPGKPSAGK